MSLDSIKRRREERLRELSKQLRQRSEGYSVEEDSDAGYASTRREISWSQEETWGDKENPAVEVRSGFLVKLLLSLFLLSFTFLIYKTELPFTAQAKDFIGQVMTREYNFQGTMALIEKYIGHPSILPTFETQMKGSPQPVWNQVSSPKKYVLPVEGIISAPFFLDGRGIQIEAAQGSEIKAVDQGWVVYVGPKEGLGQTVIVRHEDQLQTWYSSVEDIQVAEEDWVQPGQVIGKAKEGNTVYFSMEMNGQFIDPASVIPFE